MEIKILLDEIHSHLIHTFKTIDTWFDKDETLRHYHPKNGGWTIDEILEHISLTNHFLLILIEKGTRKALQNAKKQDQKTALEYYFFQRDKLTEIGLHRSFPWMRPAHMEPSGSKPISEIRLQLKEQLAQCLHCLDQMPNGEGLLYTTTMTVNDLGKINVYEYIYFLAQHGKRHLMQMERNEEEFKHT
jgi:hypothetical protein